MKRTLTIVHVRKAMLSRYEVIGDKIHIFTAYCEDVVNTCRKWAGKYNKDKGCWIVSLSRLSEIQQHLGKNQEDQVEVEVYGENYRETGGQIHLGWYVLAGRKSRDQRADVYAELVNGEIPSWGGSVKYPRV